MAHRLSSAKAVSPLTRRRPLISRSTIGRNKYESVSQVRCLWWWGRRANEWSSSFDEDLEEKMRRQQRILRHRYSKMLRRRAMWERDSALRFQWPLRLRGHWLGSRVEGAQNLSSTQSPQAKVEEHDSASKKKHAPWAEFHEDFESFRKAVDKAVERDPYGTLFGRRLQSPPSANNSSWTSFSWIFDPKEIKEDKSDPKNEKPHEPSQSKATATSSAEATFERTADPIPSKQPINASSEYEFDPITMRKVPKQQKSDVKTSTLDSRPKSLFDTLFGENGASIPVKIYKPPKVYGYAPAEKQTSKPKPDAETSRKGFENSQKREFLKLKASVLGNNIDTTAEFGGKYQDAAEIPPAPQAPPEEPPTKRVRESAAPDDGAPLFSGTTYEGKTNKMQSTAAPKSEWLRSEGFGSASSSTQAGGKHTSEAVDIPVKKFNRIQPSLDRMRAPSPKPSKSDPVRLQPALDRSKTPTSQKVCANTTSQHSRSLKAGLDEKTEDMDLLRASDLRAKMKTTGTIKQEMETLKEQARERLEADYIARQKGNSTESTGDSALARSMTHVWRHVGQYPNGIVARTMRSMGIFNDNFKKYRSPERPPPDLTKKLVFSDESLSKVSSIYRKPKLSLRPTPSFNPSPEVMKAEADIKMRRVALKEAQIEAEKRAKLTDQQANALGKEIKAIYENEYGTIDLQHRQKVTEPKVVDLATGTTSTDHKSNLHPLRSATVKEGVPRFPEIEAHVSEFEPKYAKIVDQAKSVKRSLHEVKTSIKDIRAEQEARRLTLEEIKAASVDRLQKPTNVGLTFEEQLPGMEEFRVATETWQQKLNADWEKIQHEMKQPVVAAEDQQQKAAETTKSQAPARTSAEEEDYVQGLDEPLSRYRSTSATAPIPAKVEPPIFVKDGSPAWADEQPPPISELKTTSYKAPYVMLKYDTTSGQVQSWEKHVILLKGSAPRSPLSLISQLEHLPEFSKHFPALERCGYSLVTGRRNALIFKRDATAPVVEKHQIQTKPNRPSAEETIAQPIIQETSSTPPPISSSEPTKSQRIEAAKVLDEIPIDITPPPGPAAPTAPPSSPGPSTKRTPSPKPTERIRRQENVFSGTIKPVSLPSNFKSPPPSTSTYNPIDPEIQAPRTTSSSTTPPKDGLFKRFTRAVRRVILTAVAFAGGAYAIGVVAEGIGAQEQVKRVAGAGSEEGPRRRVVVDGYRPGTRPGIYSTESSR